MGTLATVGPAAAGPPALVRKINGDGEYEVDPDTNQFRSTSKLEQLVYLALSTRRGSATAKRELGVRRITTIGTDFERRMEANIRQAVQHITDAGLGELIAVQVFRSPLVTGRALARVTIQATGASDPVTLGPVPLAL